MLLPGNVVFELLPPGKVVFELLPPGDVVFEFPFGELFVPAPF